MCAYATRSIEDRVRPILAEAFLVAKLPAQRAARPRGLFVTINRQAWAGGWSLAQRLVDELNNCERDARQPWTCWDRELVEKVAADHHISHQLIESLEDSGRSWLEEFLASLSSDKHQAEELKVYRRVAATIRALAEVGRVVIVGRGGSYITRGIPGGTHVRLVAPADHRIRSMARKLGIPPDEAAVRVRQIDQNRLAFYRRYWPNESLSPESFTVTLNAAEIDEQTMVDCLARLIHGRHNAPAAAAAAVA